MDNIIVASLNERISNGVTPNRLYRRLIYRRPERSTNSSQCSLRQFSPSDIPLVYEKKSKPGFSWVI